MCVRRQLVSPVCSEACGPPFHLTLHCSSRHLSHTRYKSHTVTNKRLTSPCLSQDTVSNLYSGLCKDPLHKYKVRHGYSSLSPSLHCLDQQQCIVGVHVWESPRHCTQTCRTDILCHLRLQEVLVLRTQFSSYDIDVT